MLAYAAVDNSQVSFAARLSFNFSTTTEGWTGAGGASYVAWGAGAGGGMITMGSSGIDPNLVRGGLAINGAQNPIIRVRARPQSASPTWEGTVYYGTAGHAYSASYLKTLPAPPSPLQQGVWQIFEWDMSALTAGGTDWISSTIQSVRFDFTNSAQDWEIDWIAFGSYAADPLTLRGVEDGATLGAAWASTLTGRPGNLSALVGSEPIQNTLLGLGENCYPNASFESGAFDGPWVAGWNGTASGTKTRGVNQAGYFGARNVAYITTTGTPTSGSVMDLLGPPGYELGSVSLDWLERFALPVAPGDRVGCWALLAYHRAQFGALIVWYFDRAGVPIPFGSGGEFTAGAGGTNGGGANGEPGNFTRVGSGIGGYPFGTAPANAAYAAVFIRCYCNGTEAYPYLFATEIMLAKVPAGQTVPATFRGSGPDRMAGRYLGDTGQINNGHGLPYNISASYGAVFNPSNPLSAGSPAQTAIAVAATTITYTEGATLSFGAATISGLTANTTYAIFYDRQTSAFLAVSSGLTNYQRSAARYIHFGYQLTAQTGGGYSPPPPPPEGGGGGTGGTRPGSVLL